ncbi:MAG: MXAN_6640 family putative metalloprotease [bacterium]
MKKNRIRYLKFFLLMLFLTHLFQPLFPWWPRWTVEAQSQDSLEQPPGFQAWLNQQVTALFQPEKKAALFRLPRPAVFSRCSTPLIRAALQHSDLLDTSNRFILYRPTDAVGAYDYYGSVAVWSYDTPDGHFRIHYTEDNKYTDAVPDSDGNSGTVPPYVLSVAGALMAVWSQEIDHMAYSPPPADGLGGGNSLFDCYILNISSYGYTNRDTQGYPYIVIDNDYSDVCPNQDPNGTALGAIRVTVAHEFFHAVQLYYTGWTNQALWWEENTAVWIEDEVFDQVNDYLHYLGSPYEDLNHNGRWDAGEPYYDTRGEFVDFYGREWSGWFDWPFLPLNHVSYGNGQAKYQEYGGVIWAKYLSEKYGSEIIQDIFDQCRKTGESALSSIQTIIASKGSSLTSEFEAYKEKVLLRDFREGEWYPQVWHAVSLYQYPALLDSHTFYDSHHGGYIGNLDHLSSHYLCFQAPEGRGNIRLSFNKTGGTAELSCPLLLNTHGGGWERIDFPLDGSGLREVTISGFGNEAEYRRVIAIPINLSTSPSHDDASFTMEAAFEALPHYRISFSSGMNLFSPAIPKGQALDSHSFMIHHFDPNSSVSLSMYDGSAGQWIRNFWLEDPNGYSISGQSFNLVQGGLYVLYSKDSRAITLEASLEPDSSPLEPGMNFLSYTPQMLDGAQRNACTLLHNEGNKILTIRKHDNKRGTWENSYQFFHRCAGHNFSVIAGETYFVELGCDDK